MMVETVLSIQDLLEVYLKENARGTMGFQRALQSRTQSHSRLG